MMPFALPGGYAPDIILNDKFKSLSLGNWVENDSGGTMTITMDGIKWALAGAPFFGLSRNIKYNIWDVKWKSFDFIVDYSIEVPSASSYGIAIGITNNVGPERNVSVNVWVPTTSSGGVNDGRVLISAGDESFNPDGNPQVASGAVQVPIVGSVDYRLRFRRDFRNDTPPEMKYVTEFYRISNPAVASIATFTEPFDSWYSVSFYSSMRLTISLVGGPIHLKNAVLSILKCHQ